MESAAAAAMAGTSGVNTGSRGGDEKKAAACDVQALQKCLEENKGDRVKCQAHIDAFRSSCSASPTISSDSDRRPAAARSCVMEFLCMLMLNDGCKRNTGFAGLELNM